MRLLVRIAPVLMLVVGTAAADIATTPGSLSIGPAFEHADLVCNCYVESLQVRDEPIIINGRSALHRRVTATVEIIQDYKQHVPSTSRVTVHYELDVEAGLRVRGSRAGLREREHALLFLTEFDDHYEFTDPYIGAVRFDSLPKLSGEAGLEMLERVLVREATGAVRADQFKALQLLQGLSKPDAEAEAAVYPLTTSDDPEIAFPALGVLLKTKSPESVERLKYYLDGHGTGTQPIAAISVGTELGLVADARCRKAVEALTTSRFVAIKYGAMDSLRRMRDTASAPTLINRLDDPDRSVQYVAVITLAEIFAKYDGDFAPSMYIFDKKPNYYTGIWKQWWAERSPQN